jgi:hypothetical protein
MIKLSRQNIAYKDNCDVLKRNVVVVRKSQNGVATRQGMRE